MTIAEILHRRSLPSVDSEILLGRILGRQRTWILAHDEYALTDKEQSQWDVLEQRRLAHEPMAYILGSKEFYGREFTVRPGVLVPRPATEGLIQTALTWLRSPSDTEVMTDTGIVALARRLGSKRVRTVIDVGTGSGCIAITLALEKPDLHLIATDTSLDALKIAQENAAKHGTEKHIQFFLGSLLEPVATLRKPFLVVSNPPYVPSGRTLPKDITAFEPPQAIFAGPDGMDVLRPLVAEIRRHPFCQGFVMECEKKQVPAIDALLK